MTDDHWVFRHLRRLRKMRQLREDEEEADRLVGKWPYSLVLDDEPPKPSSPGQQRLRASGTRLEIVRCSRGR